MGPLQSNIFLLTNLLLKSYPNLHHLKGCWNLPNKFQLHFFMLAPWPVLFFQYYIFWSCSIYKAHHCQIFGHIQLLTFVIVIIFVSFSNQVLVIFFQSCELASKNVMQFQHLISKELINNVLQRSCFLARSRYLSLLET